VVVAASYTRSSPECIPKIAKRVGDAHDFRMNYLKMDNITKELVETTRADTNFGEWGKMAEDAVGEDDEIRHSEFCNRLQKLSASGTDLRRNALIPPGFLRWVVLSLGYKEIGCEADPLYRL